jgi:hypothetical protein
MLLMPLQVRGTVTYVFTLHNQLYGFTWVTDHLKRLRLLGIMLVETLQCAKSRKRLKESEVLLAQAESITHFGSWKWDLISDTHQWSEEFYRINIFPITIPPLRHRKEDIAPLVKFYIDRFNKSLGKKINRIQNNTILTLQDYDWKGNVRELSNIIERSVIQSNGHEFKLSEKFIKSSVVSAADDAPNFSNRSLEKNLLEIERKHILNVLEEAGWRIEGPHGAAHRLGLNPSTLRGKMKKLSIKRPGTV